MPRSVALEEVRPQVGLPPVTRLRAHRRDQVPIMPSDQATPVSWHEAFLAGSRMSSLRKPCRCPSSARAPRQSPTARPTTDPRQAPCWASAWPRDARTQRLASSHRALAAGSSGGPREPHLKVQDAVHTITPGMRAPAAATAGHPAEYARAEAGCRPRGVHVEDSLPAPREGFVQAGLVTAGVIVILGGVGVAALLAWQRRRPGRRGPRHVPLWELAPAPEVARAAHLRGRSRDGPEPGRLEVPAAGWSLRAPVADRAVPMTPDPGFALPP